MKTGICSITFRQLDIPQLTDLVREAGLDAIEWGGDIHVKPGDIAAAQEAKQRTFDAGLVVSSYGSYYNVLDKDGHEQEFAPVLDSALALGTDTIRIWSGSQPSESATPEYRMRFIKKLRFDLDLAAAHGIRLALEFHVNSLNDSNAAAFALLNEVNHPNIYTYWQPIYWIADSDYRFEGLKKLRDRVLNLHVFHWQFYPMRGGWGENLERRPLAEGSVEWRRFLSIAPSPGEHYALIEFVRGDDPLQLIRDAATLKEWLSPT